MGKRKAKAKPAAKKKYTLPKTFDCPFCDHNGVSPRLNRSAVALLRHSIASQHKKATQNAKSKKNPLSFCHFALFLCVAFLCCGLHFLFISASAIVFLHCFLSSFCIEIFALPFFSRCVLHCFVCIVVLLYIFELCFIAICMIRAQYFPSPLRVNFIPCRPGISASVTHPTPRAMPPPPPPRPVTGHRLWVYFGSCTGAA